MSEHKIIERLVDDLITRVEALEEKADEIWVPVKDNCNYFISNKGRVKHYQGRESKVYLNKSQRYYRVTLNGRQYLLHRLLAEAFIPNPERKPCVDHIDGDPVNNSLKNLRWATYAENQYNKKTHKNNSSGQKGVYFNEEKGKWHARIWIAGKNRHLGYFHTAEEATATREKAAKELHGEYYCER